MATWNLTIPIGTEDANTLHTLIQNVKIDIMERMRVTNADSEDEHLVYGSSATGRHPLSLVGFTESYADLASFALLYPTIFPREGTLHFIRGTNRLYVGRRKVVGSIDPIDYIELVSTTDHGEYNGLDEDDHTQYILTDGSRVMTGNLTLDAGGVLSVTAAEDADDQPLNAMHTFQSWHDAHGASSIIETHFAADSFTGLYVLAFNDITGGTLDFCISGIGTVPFDFYCPAVNSYRLFSGATIKRSSLSQTSRSV
jgi:hypothetical protein